MCYLDVSSSPIGGSASDESKIKWDSEIAKYVHRLQIKVPPFIHRQDIRDLEESCHMIELGGGLHVSGGLCSLARTHKVFELLLQTVKPWGRREHLEWHVFEQLCTYVLMGFD